MPEPTFLDMPVELVLDNLLPLLSVRDALALGSTSRRFFVIIQSDVFWKRRLVSDYNFAGVHTAREGGWKIIYKGLSNPETYVWGDAGEYRLGLGPSAGYYGIPYPTRLHVPGVRFVDIIAGGWSFHALDSKGNIFVWGTLNNERREAAVETPTKLQMPVKFKALSSGRRHSIALDTEGYVWNFLEWKRPYRLVSSLLDPSIPGSTPIQVESGWTFSSVLTESGDVYVWFPLGTAIPPHIPRWRTQKKSNGNQIAFQKHGVVPCITWDLDHALHILPGLPTLPMMGIQPYNEADVKFVKIAAMEESLIGLTNKGHVLKFDGLREEVYDPHDVWTYLPFFSEWSKIQQHPDMSIPFEVDEKLSEKSTQITHISANFRTFVVYSVKKNSIILIGKSDANNETGPKIISSLQNRSVISVVVGDYHNGALTDDGKLLTWGSYSNGALGLGPRNSWERVEIPSEVSFNHDSEGRGTKFCFGVAAAGWHMSALVFNLEDKDDVEIPSRSIDQDDQPPPTQEGSRSLMQGLRTAFRRNRGS